jgi:nucleotide-binding universal stress UspA family protein
MLELKIRSILYATDFSPEAEGALPMALSLARDHGARLIVLHVYPPPAFHGEVVARRQPNGYEEQLWTELRRIQSPDAKVHVEHRLAEGDAAAEILRVAREGDCDLIVMGTHGRTGVRRVLMGSVAEQVVRAAQCPVITVRATSSWTRRAPEAAADDVVQPSDA